MCCRKGGPLQAQKLGFCLPLGNDLSEETHVLTKQEILLGKGTQENCSAMWLAVLGFMTMGLVSGWPSANRSDSRVLPGGAHSTQPRWMPVRRILGGGQTRDVSF